MKVYSKKNNKAGFRDKYVNQVTSPFLTLNQPVGKNGRR